LDAISAGRKTSGEGTGGFACPFCLVDLIKYMGEKDGL
jgi:hypothetical protein